MAQLPFKLPDIGEGIAEAEIVEWHAKPGDAVSEGQVIVAVMTDKATVEMEAPAAGTLIEQGGKAGDLLPIGSVLFVLEVEGAVEEPAPVTPEPAPRVAAARPASAPTSTPAPSSVPVEQGAPRAQPPVGTEAGKVLAAPAVRHRARELGIDLAAVPATGDHVRHEDLDRFLLGRQTPGPVPMPRPVPERESISGASPVLTGGKAIPITGLRRQIARRMEETARHIPHFTYVDECDVTDLETLRDTLNSQPGHGAPLQPLPVLVLAICRALDDFPAFNAHFDDERDVVTRFSAVHMGIATQTDKGLMVPVLRDVERLDVRQIAAGIADLSARARAGALTRDELAGSTFTMTSLGKLGGIAATPLINRPEVAILAPHRIVERCVWNGREAEPRKMMNLSLSCDHRIIDGQDAALFIQAIKGLLEQPVSLGLM